MCSAKRSPRSLGMHRSPGLPGRRPGLFRSRVFRRRGRRDPFAGGPGQGEGKLQEEVRQIPVRSRTARLRDEIIHSSSSGGPPP